MKTKSLPDGWQEVELGEVCEIVSGSTPSTSKPEYWEGDIDWVTPAELSNGHNWYYTETARKISEDGLQSCSSVLFPKGTVMLTTRAPIGKVAIAGKEMCSNQGFKNFICNKNSLNPEFLYFWLRANKTYIQYLGRGATFTEVSKSIVSKIKIPLPHLETQKKIVAVLEKAEQLKQKRAEADRLTDDYLKAVFAEMFGDPQSNPKKWPIFELKEIAEVERNSISPEKIKDHDNYIGLEHIESGSGKIITVIKTSDVELKSSKFAFDGNCLLYGKLRPYLNKIALPDFKGVCSTDIIPIRPIQRKANRLYLAYLLRQQYYVDMANSLANGANLPRLSPQSLQKIKTSVPPIELQNKFASIVERAEKMKEKQKKSKEHIEDLFNSLMQKAFKGELVS